MLTASGNSKKWTHISNTFLFTLLFPELAELNDVTNQQLLNGNQLL